MGVLQLKTENDFAAKSFNVSSHYDIAIFNYFNRDNEESVLKLSETQWQSFTLW